MINQSLTKQIRFFSGCTGPQEIRSFLSEDKRVAGDIKERISNRLKLSSRRINNKISKDILNYFYYVENVTWLCDKARFYQSSNNWLSKFMQRYNFTKNKHSNKKVNKLEESRERCQCLHSYFYHIFFTHNCY